MNNLVDESLKEEFCVAAALLLQDFTCITPIPNKASRGSRDCEKLKTENVKLVFIKRNQMERKESKLVHLHRYSIVQSKQIQAINFNTLLMKI